MAAHERAAVVTGVHGEGGALVFVGRAARRPLTPVAADVFEALEHARDGAGLVEDVCAHEVTSSRALLG